MGDKGIRALADAMQPFTNSVGHWEFPGAITSLQIGIRLPVRAKPSFLARLLFPPRRLLELISCHLPGNNCGQEGLEPIVKVLRPRMNPDDSIAHSTVNLSNFLSMCLCLARGVTALQLPCAPFAWQRSDGNSGAGRISSQIPRFVPLGHQRTHSAQWEILDCLPIDAVRGPLACAPAASPAALRCTVFASQMAGVEKER